MNYITPIKYVKGKVMENKLKIFEKAPPDTLGRSLFKYENGSCSGFFCILFGKLL